MLLTQLFRSFDLSLKTDLVMLKSHCCSSWSYVCNAFFFLIAWAVFPLENKLYKKIFRNRAFYFPQINFHSLHPLDAFRILIQLGFLCLFVITKDKFSQRKAKGQPGTLSQFVRYVRVNIGREIRNLSETLSKLLLSDSSSAAEKGKNSAEEPTPHKMGWVRKTMIGLLLSVGLVLYFLCITQPFSLEEQIIFLSILWVSALLLFQAQTRLTLLMLIVISVIVSSRYIWWRYTETINPNSFMSVIFSWMLILAETYAFIVMLLGYFQVCWALDRKPTSMPKDPSLWPHVDIFIPTYNEPLDVVKPTVYACLTMDWPKEKLHVHVLDDGSRPEFEEFSNSVGAGYIKREKHNHAKAGNINHALTKTSGEFITIFDCDHVPVRSFLKKTMGWFFKDKNIALIQTPHHFYSQDPFEKNLHLSEHVPNENSLFHDFIQKGNDTWNATMFCGSCAIMRRKALEEVGGIAVETVTEDAHTSLKLNRKGWSSAFLSTPLSAGLSTETLAAHIGQRIRWARGMIQIFRLDNPLFGKGLTIPQRLCFLNAMIHFLHGLPRIIFLLAPLPFLFANIYVIYASAIAIFVYLVPHMVHSTMTTYVIHKGYRFPFVSAIYETILSWYIFVPTLVAIFAPHKGKFNVTAKGGVIDKAYVDWSVAKPYLYLLILNLAGLCFGLYKMIGASQYQVLMLAINIGWILYNLIILFASIAVCVESVQQRKFPRVAAMQKVTVELSDGHKVKAVLAAFSQKDCQLVFKIPSAIPNFKLGESVKLIFGEGKTIHEFNCTVSAIFSAGVIDLDVHQETLQKEKEYTACTFGVPELWINKQAKIKGFGMLDGFMALLRMARQGVEAFVHYTPPSSSWLFYITVGSLKWIISFIPRVPKLRSQSKQTVFAS